MPRGSSKSKKKPRQSFTDTASFGKRQEFIAIARLLEEGFDVYQTLVDDKQIDCVIRGHGEPVPVYVDVQIKARSKNAGEKSWATWPGIKLPSPRANFFFVFFSQPRDAYWVVPSEELAKYASQNKSGKYASNYTVTLETKTADGWRKNPSFARFKNDFETLREFLDQAPIE